MTESKPSKTVFCLFLLGMTVFAGVRGFFPHTTRACVGGICVPGREMFDESEGDQFKELQPSYREVVME